MNEHLEKAKAALAEAKASGLGPNEDRYVHLVEVARVQATVAQAEALETIAVALLRIERKLDPPLFAEQVTDWPDAGKPRLVLENRHQQADSAFAALRAHQHKERTGDG